MQYFQVWTYQGWGIKSECSYYEFRNSRSHKILLYEFLWSVSKESFNLKKGEELTVFVQNSGFPISYTVFDADNQVIGTFNANSPYGRVFKAQKDGNISVQFQVGVNSTYMKKMNFTAKFAVSKLNQQ